MNRRAFLKYGALSGTVIGIGAAGYAFGFRNRGLAANLRSLSDPFFEEAAQGIDANAVLVTLRAKGVISEDGEIVASVVNELAKSDESIVYRGRYYTRTELDLYSLAWLSSQPEVSVPD